MGNESYGLLNIIVEAAVPVSYHRLVGVNAFFKRAVYHRFILSAFSWRNYHTFHSVIITIRGTNLGEWCLFYEEYHASKGCRIVMKSTVVEC